MKSEADPAERAAFKSSQPLRLSGGKSDNRMALRTEIIEAKTRRN